MQVDDIMAVVGGDTMAVSEISEKYITLKNGLKLKKDKFEFREIDGKYYLRPVIDEVIVNNDFYGGKK